MLGKLAVIEEIEEKEKIERGVFTFLTSKSEGQVGQNPWSFDTAWLT